MALHSLLYLLPVAAYLLGSIPVGLLLVRWRMRKDVRGTGSGNIGATNVWRTAGKGLAIATLVGDALKGALPCLAALWLAGRAFPMLPSWYGVVVGAAAVAGHMFPLYLGFRASGKGVATAAGVFSVLAPLACGIAFSVFILLALVTRRVSIGSLIGALVLPPALWFTTRDPYLAGGGTLIMLMILARHRDNIQRLRQGKEPRFKGRTD